MKTPAAPGALALLLPLLSTALAAQASAEAPAAVDLEEVVITAPSGQALARDRVPARVQTATAADIESLQPLDLSELLNRAFGSVSLNHAQNNPLQPDLNFRGFTASPLLGLAQGLSVYANGVRLNESFGDTVNWDLLPVSAIHAVQLSGGTNPVFGLNSLGGALSLQLKNGFNAAGTHAEAYTGAFGRRGASLQHGRTAGAWGYYANIDHFEEDGWRDFSPSRALRGFGSLGYRQGEDQLDLSLALADTSLRGNGPAPAELLALDRRAVFTHPDVTDNRAALLMLEGSTRLAPGLQLSGTAFARRLRTGSFNGDGTIFEECAFGADEFLVEQDFTDVDGNDACDAGVDQDIEPVLGTDGAALAAEWDGEELDAINNLSQRRQRSHGGSLQLTHDRDLAAGRGNHLLLGASLTDGRTDFTAVTEVARLLEDRSTSRTGLYVPEFATAVDSRVATWSLYAIDTLDLTPSLTLTLAGRHDSTRITLEDRSGSSPELNGRHRFSRFNPAVGLSYRHAGGWRAYATFSQASRTPTAVELACADADAPCSLPNAFLADPPLDEVVARNAELGVQGQGAERLQWQVALFRTVNRDDILFQTTGGAQANVGFFDNVADTRRQGVEVELERRGERWSWQLDYSWVDATFQDAFTVNSPNHPLFAQDSVPVPAGSPIPGIARHQANLVLAYRATERLRLGADLQYRSGVSLRGDEVDALGRTAGHAVVNLRADLRIGADLMFFARIDNLFDRRYETFGLLGEPDEVFPQFQDPRFLGAGPPRGAWVGLRWSPFSTP